MKSLPDITLCCIDTRTPELGYAALLRSSEKIIFGDVLFVTSEKFQIPEKTPPNLRVIRTSEIGSITAYSTFMIKGLRALIKTPYCLIIQWDGFIIHPENWNDLFLSFDYIGAPWQTQNGLVVGNGGFSLRSLRLLDALAAENIVPKHPEDDCICITYRKQLETKGILFAPADIAQKFSFEFTSYEQQFGFHGLSNFPDIFSQEELFRFITQMPETLFVNEYFIGFSKKLSKLGNRNILDLLSKRIITHIKRINEQTYQKQQLSFLVESLIYLGLYRQAIQILLTKAYGVAWKPTFLKIFIRKTFGKLAGN